MNRKKDLEISNSINEDEWFWGKIWLHIIINKLSKS